MKYQVTIRDPGQVFTFINKTFRTPVTITIHSQKQLNLIKTFIRQNHLEQVTIEENLLEQNINFDYDPTQQPKIEKLSPPIESEDDLLNLIAE